MRAAEVSAPMVAGVRISHADRVMVPSLGLTKLDLARYVERVGEVMVPHTRGRPLTLVRCGEGVEGPCAYMRHARAWGPAALRRVRIQEKTKVGEYLVADTVEALVALAQMDVVEVHTWNAAADDVERPDRIVLDLDPGPEVRWSTVVEAARRVRAAMAALGLESFVKTTGGAGLHVVAPLAPTPWRACLAFARALAEALARHDPRTFTTRFAKRGREGVILLDYLRNNRTNTSVAAYSVRARPDATVSVPLAWDELDGKKRPERFTVRTVPRRIARSTTDPWASSWGLAQGIPEGAVAALAAIG